MIGVFDSGSGGLSVLSVLRKRAPDADLLYFGDIANAPYGEKSLPELATLTEKGISLLKDCGATELISACNSVSSAVLAGASGGLPYIEMSKPTAAYLRQLKGTRFLLIATPATVQSGLYMNAIGRAAEIDSLSIAGLAGAIEFGAPEADIVSLVRTAFSERSGEQYDGIVLGCTHYPLIAGLIQPLVAQYFGRIEIIDPAYPVTNEAIKTFDISGAGTLRLMISEENENFTRRIASMFPGAEASIEVVTR